MDNIETVETVETNTDRIKRYTNIAFCQKKFYTAPAWNRAIKCMNVLIEKGLAEPYDYGRGKGKFNTTSKGDELAFNELYLEVVKSGLVIKPIKERK